MARDEFKNLGFADEPPKDAKGDPKAAEKKEILW
jgi:hypothetical protein